MSKQGNHDDRSFIKAIAEAVRQEYEKRRTNVPIGQDQWTHDRLGLKLIKDSPYVAFIRMGGTMQATDRAAGIHEFIGQEGTDDEQKLYFTAKFEDVAIVDVHVVGSDDCETETIWNAVIRAVRDSLGKFAVPTTYVWPLEEQGEEEASIMHAGQSKVVQTFAITILVPHEIGKLNELKGFETTATLKSSGGDGGTTEKTIVQKL